MKGLFIADSGGTLQGRGYSFATGGGGGGGGSTTTIFGYNYNNSDTAAQTISGRLASFNNRAPCVRVYNGGLMPSTFSLSSNICPELRAAYSFKEGTDSAGLAAGNYNASMISWLNGIPPNWTIFWTFHHEPNSTAGLELPLADYLGTYHQMRVCLNAASLASGVQVYITANFMGYQLSTFNMGWIPPRADCDILTWDLYGNPGTNTSSSGSNVYGGPATGTGYGTTYPLISQRLGPMFQITDAAGYADSWGFLEVNSPARDWDTGEAGRVAWHQDYISTALNPPMTGAVPPKVMLLWEAPSGANWNQSYGRLSGNPAPMVNVWKPYITGTPVGGV